MTPEPAPSAAPAAKRRRWWRIARWLVVLWVVGGCGYKAWRWYDFRAAMKEAKALGWGWEYDDPWDAVQNDWKAAFRAATWNEGKRELEIPNAEALARHARLVRRLAPRSLFIADASGLKDLSVFEGLSGLQMLSLYGCKGLTEFGPLAKLPALQSLHLINCTGVTELGPLAKLPALQHLFLYGCTGVTDLRPLAQLPALQTLFLNGCTGVRELEPLAKLPALQTLDLNGCTGLKAGEVEKLWAALPQCSIDGP